MVKIPISDQDVIPPDLTKTPKVILAGFIRTGTVSMSIAMQILLKGPVCHSGSACLMREEAYIKKWISILAADPATDQAMIKDTLRSLAAGYLAISDGTAALFSGELAELYPDAVVICTTRDPVTWHRSVKEVGQTVNLMTFLDYLFLPMPTLRYFGTWVKALEIRGANVYNNGKKYDVYQDDIGKKHLDHHVAYLKRVIPPSRLHFFNVKDGWAPLCKILNLPVPDVPFPHANDKDAIQEALIGFIKQALLRWLMMFAAAGVVLALLIWAWSLA